MRFTRTQTLLGDDAMQKLKAAHVAVFGLGGVGSYVVEALSRSGVGALTLIDGDAVDETNCNRQLYALTSTIGRAKVDVARERVLEINPGCRVNAQRLFYLPGLELPLDGCDFIVDAIDTVTAKLGLIDFALKRNIPILCAAGAGNKLDPTRLKISDIYETSVCPLCRVLRQECKKRGIGQLRVAWSDEKPAAIALETTNGRHPPASAVFVPAGMGLLIAREVVREIVG